MGIIRQRIPSTDPRLNRHVNHDSRSRAYAVSAEGVTIGSVQHVRHVPVFDQGRIGSCTGNAGVGCTGTSPFYATLSAPKYSWDESGAVALYSRETQLDGYPGTYPPDDTGSDGLTCAKALKEAGEISGYLSAFTPEAARAALMSAPVITGIIWLESMFNPLPNGQVVVDRASAVAGGHEIVVDGYEVIGATPSASDRVWLTNSWGTSWGLNGRFWMTFGDWSWLLSQQGDVTQFVPISSTPPQPQPVTDEKVAGDALWTVVQHWTTEHHVGDNAHAASAVKAWAKSTGRV